MSEVVYLAHGARTPIGAFNGQFADLSASELGSVAVQATMKQARIAGEEVDEVYMGNVLSAGLGQNVARQVAIGSGLPVTCGATTINKMCGSSLRTIRLAAQAVQCGDGEVIVAGGTESMTRAPYLALKARSGYRMGHGELLDSMIYDGLWDAFNDAHMGQLAERCASKHGVSRADQDAFAVQSYHRAAAAQESGRFKSEIAPVIVKQRHRDLTIDADEEPTRFREDRVTTLKPVFAKDGTITPANASGISDGAAAILVAGDDAVRRLDLEPAAKLLGYTSVAVDPEWFTEAPIHAVRKLCDQLNVKPADVDLFEINEAFSVVVMVTMRELDLSHDKVNILGGAVALGHPIGASGARIVVTLINALRARQARLGIATVCIGGGEAEAVAVELV